jgi:copper oxidase (laccase) domain-containing protein
VATDEQTAPRQDFTPDEIVAGISTAIQARDFDVIPGLVKYLATKDPHRAQRVLDALHGRYTIDLGDNRGR